MKKLVGRPKHLRSHAEIFLKHFLDPLNSIQEVAEKCGIKKSTVYNYERELGLPTLKVALGTAKAHLPKDRVLKSISDKDELYELNLIRQLGVELNCRIKIIPIDSYVSHSPLQLVERKEVDFLVSSFTKTRKIETKLYCSNEYFTEGGPSGVIVYNPKFDLQRSFLGNRKPTLGVLEDSVHSEFAMSQLQQEYLVKTFKLGRNAFLSLKTGAIDFALFHESWLRAFPAESLGLKICSKEIKYSTNSAIIFHADSCNLLKPIDLVLDRIHAEYGRGK